MMGSIVTRDNVRTGGESSQEVTGSNIGTKRYLDTTSILYGTDGATIRPVAVDDEGRLEVVVVASLPTPPVLSTVTPANQQNTLTWTAVAGATDYKIYWATTSGVTISDNEIITGSTSLTYVHTSLTNGTTYYYRVVAVGAWGDTLVGTENSGTPVAFTNALSTLFDGVNEYVDFGDNHNFENNVPFTGSFWVKVSNILGSNKSIWGKATNDASLFGWMFLVKVTTGQAQLNMRASGQLRNIVSNGTPFLTSVWVHAVVTSTGNQNISGVRLYFDGVVDSSTSTGTVTNTLIHTDPSQIAGRNGTTFLNGNVDEATFWSVAMDATEVAELYNSGTPDDPNNHSQAANLLNWYKAGDGDTHPTWLDNFGSVDGTMTNTDGDEFVSDTP